MEVTFECANMPIAAAARALGVDRQTVRLLIQNGLVEWGTAYKRTPASQHFSYLISPLAFYQATGYLYRGGADHEQE